jgi:hypothetical protein
MYRIASDGQVYRQSPRGNEVLTFFGWKACTFYIGEQGWRDILRVTQPIAINPAWPA